MKQRRVVGISVMMVVSLAAVGAVAMDGVWLEAIDEREREVERALERADVVRGRIETLEEHIDGRLTDADTARRATEDLRREVSAQVARWEMAEAEARRVQLLEGPTEGTALMRALQVGRPAASKSWRDQVELLGQVQQGVEQAGEFLVYRSQLSVEYAQHRGEARQAEAEREAIAEEARERGEQGGVRDEFEATARELERELERARTNPTGEDFHRRKGALIPPVSVGVAYGFGPRAQRDSDSFVRHTGLTYVVEEGTEVRSVGEGLVVFAERMAGYGRLVIVDHGRGYHSLYAHLQRLDVDLGDRVRNRQVVGLSGDSGSLEGPKLYFELRRGGMALDPQEWFVTR